MLCTAPRWKIKFVMFLIPNAPSLLGSCLSHTVTCTRLQLQTVLCPVALALSCVLWLCPVPQPPPCPGLLLLAWVGCSERQPMFLVAVGLFPLLWTKSWGSLEEQGLCACRFNSQPCVQTMPSWPSTQCCCSKWGFGARCCWDGNVHISSTQCYFSCHHSCQFRPCLD